MSTTLPCLPWMQSQTDQNPCMIAQEVGQLCNTEYSVSLTNFQESNYVPNATTTNKCTCSWSIYNLLSACSYCVGKYQYTSWDTWVSDCGSYASNTSYLPSGLSLSKGIPFWATTNPSTWDNAVFNITQAEAAAGGSYLQLARPDVTGAPLPTSSTSTTSVSSASHVSVGAIVGGVIGAIAIVIVGGLIICWVMRRRRTTPSGVPSFIASHPATLPPPSVRHWNSTLQPSSLGYTYISPGPHVTSPVRSTTSLGLETTSPLSSPVSAFSHGRSASQPITDAANLISPFLTMSPVHQTNQSSTSQPTPGRSSKAAEALAERATAPPRQRTRLNPPSYSASVGPEAPAPATIGFRRLSLKRKKRDGSVSGTTTYSGHSRTSTRESIATLLGNQRTEQTWSRAATTGTGTGTAHSAENAAATGMHTRNAGQRPPAV